MGILRFWGGKNKNPPPRDLSDGKDGENYREFRFSGKVEKS
jgi:hypothetical protein